VNDLPQVSLYSHSEGQTVYGRVNLEGTSYDIDGTINLVQIKIGSSPSWIPLSGQDYWTYIWDTSELEDGIYDIQIRARDDKDAYSQDYSIKLEVLNKEAPNEIPTVKITHPTGGEIITQGSVKVRGTAFDRDGGIDSVEIKFDDGEWVKTNGSIDWFYTIDTSGLSKGEYSIYVRSYDGREYSPEKNLTVEVFNTATKKDDGDSLTTDKEGQERSSNFLYLVIILIVVVIIILAAVGVYLRKKKREEDELEGTEKAALAPAAEEYPIFNAELFPQLQSPAQAPGGAEAPSLPPPTPVSIDIPQLSSGTAPPAPQSEAPKALPPAPQPVEASPSPTTPPAATPAPPAPAAPAPAPAAPPAAEPAANDDAIDITSVAVPAAPAAVPEKKPEEKNAD
jgi:cytoskeletal protein RodZ